MDEPVERKLSDGGVFTWMLDCGQPGSCQAYFKTEVVEEPGKPPYRRAIGSFCKCTPPREAEHAPPFTSNRG